MAKAPKILTLESLRGVLAIFVVLTHIKVESHFRFLLVDRASPMVDFFFVISGFVIALNYQFAITGIQSLWAYQRSRFLRIYPLHFIVLLIFLAIEFVKYAAEVRIGIKATNPAFSINTAESFFLNLVLLQNWFLPYLTWNGPSWSISAEFYVYAIFGVLVLVARRSLRALVLCSLAIVGLTMPIVMELGVGTSNISGPSRAIYGFFIGVIAFNVYHYFSLRGRVRSSWPIFIFIVSSFLAISYMGEIYGYLGYFLMPFVFALTIVVIAATSEQALLNRVLSNRVLVFLGTVSYGVYMIHTAVWWVVNQILRFGFKVQERENVYGEMRFYLDSPLLGDLTVFAGLSATLFLAYLSHRYIETRFTQKSFPA